MSELKHEENTLKQAQNVLNIEGILLEKKFEEKKINGKDAILGELEIETGENSTHTVGLFSYLLTNDGKENGFAKGLRTIMNEYKTVQEVGREEADRIRTYQGSLKKNEYVGQDGLLKSYNQFSANSVNRLKSDEELMQQAKFKVEIFIQNIVPEIKSEEETGRVIIKGLVALYGGKIAPFDFVVQGDKEISFIESNYQAGDTVLLSGDIINTVEVKKIVTEMAFGDDIEEIEKKTVRELLVTGGTPPYEEERAYSPELIKKALTQREITLEAMKERSKNKSKDTNSGSRNDGFGTMSAKDKEKYDIPF